MPVSARNLFVHSFRNKQIINVGSIISVFQYARKMYIDYMLHAVLSNKFQIIILIECIIHDTLFPVMYALYRNMNLYSSKK
jgi:hypothetical protein